MSNFLLTVILLSSGIPLSCQKEPFAFGAPSVALAISQYLSDTILLGTSGKKPPVPLQLPISKVFNVSV